jgi:hypothetical protein
MNRPFFERLANQLGTLSSSARIRQSH